jgi:hypothetical protein
MISLQDVIAITNARANPMSNPRRFSIFAIAVAVYSLVHRALVKAEYWV